jgi:hypothetical protein
LGARLPGLIDLSGAGQPITPAATLPSDKWDVIGQKGLCQAFLSRHCHAFFDNRKDLLKVVLAGFADEQTQLHGFNCHALPSNKSSSSGKSLVVSWFLLIQFFAQRLGFVLKRAAPFVDQREQQLVVGRLSSIALVARRLLQAAQVERRRRNYRGIRSARSTIADDGGSTASQVLCPLRAG